jgi:hypothetical protein
VEHMVNGLPLPGALCEAIAEGRWRPPPGGVLAAVLGDEPDDVRFYDLAEMRRQNAGLLKESEDRFDWVVPGSAGWDRRLTVIIGDLGADMPIALDYRRSRDRPRVLYLGDGGWDVVAPDIETLLVRLGLGV